MLHWKATKIIKNHYLLASTDNNDFIEVQLSTGLPGEPEVLFTDSKDLSSDNVMFYPNPYPTEDSDPDPVIGEAYQYSGKKCIGKALVTAVILNTNVPDKAKGYLEVACV